jgi:hypothetical protein
MVLTTTGRAPRGRSASRPAPRGLRRRSAASPQTRAAAAVFCPLALTMTAATTTTTMRIMVAATRCCCRRCSRHFRLCSPAAALLPTQKRFFWAGVVVAAASFSLSSFSSFSRRHLSAAAVVPAATPPRPTPQGPPSCGLSPSGEPTSWRRSVQTLQAFPSGSARTGRGAPLASHCTAARLRPQQQRTSACLQRTEAKFSLEARTADSATCCPLVQVRERRAVPAVKGNTAPSTRGKPAEVTRVARRCPERKLAGLMWGDEGDARMCFCNVSARGGFRQAFDRGLLCDRDLNGKRIAGYGQ